MKKNLRNLGIALLLMGSGLLGLIFSWYTHREDEVQVIQTFHSPALFVKQLTGDPDAGRKIFKEFCSTCHGKPPIIDVHAPLIGDQKAWRAQQKINIETLLKITTQGVGAMPARGGCFECSDEQLRMTIRYILSQS